MRKQKLQRVSNSMFARSCIARFFGRELVSKSERTRQVTHTTSKPAPEKQASIQENKRHTKHISLYFLPFPSSFLVSFFFFSFFAFLLVALSKKEEKKVWKKKRIRKKKANAEKWIWVVLFDGRRTCPSKYVSLPSHSDQSNSLFFFSPTLFCCCWLFPQNPKEKKPKRLLVRLFRTTKREYPKNKKSKTKNQVW